jgi:hypothetical protein
MGTGGAPVTDRIRDRNAVLEPLIGEWSLAMIAPDQPWPDVLPDAGARVTFEWLGDRAFLLERWSVPIPEAPDGLAVLGWDEGRGTFLQHYFDTRGVARVYAMTFEDGIWTLERTGPDFSPFDFAQRFTGRLSDDGARIDGAWEIAEDGTTWAKDFDLVYRRVR